MTNITRCVVDSADKSNLSRFGSEAWWFQGQVNRRRIGYLLLESKPVRKGIRQSGPWRLMTRCARHVGGCLSMWHGTYQTKGTYPLVHNPGKSHYVSGPVWFPVARRLYRRDEAIRCWEECVNQHYPLRHIPTKAKQRAPFHKEVLVWRAG